MQLLILGTGAMAAQHAEAFGNIDDVEIAAAVDPQPERLASFCDRFGIMHRFAQLSEALDWDGFEAVANVTPDSLHHVTTMACLSAGKHVLCEKPLATDHELAAEMARTADKAGVVGMVNLLYRGVAPLQQARRMTLAGEIGEVKHVEASYLQSWLAQPSWGDWRTDDRWLWRLSTRHGSNGVLGDIGIHILDFVCHGAALDITDVHCRLKTFQKAADDRIGDYQLDANDSFTINASFDNGAIGVVHGSRWASGYLNELALRIYGDKGGLEVKSWRGGHLVADPRYSSLRASLGQDMETGTWRDLQAPPEPLSYRHFVDAVRKNETQEPSFATAARLQQVLDTSFDSHARNAVLPIDPES
ncbi:MAG: Gfo/Idh/MocA family protein [Geminicoccales bacterium]